MAERCRYRKRRTRSRRRPVTRARVRTSPPSWRRGKQGHRLCGGGGRHLEKDGRSTPQSQRTAPLCSCCWVPRMQMCRRQTAARLTGPFTFIRSESSPSRPTTRSGHRNVDRLTDFLSVFPPSPVGFRGTKSPWKRSGRGRVRNDLEV